MIDTAFYEAGSLPPAVASQARSFMRTHWTFLFEPGTRSRPGLWWLAELEPVHVVATEGEHVVAYAAIVRTRVGHRGQDFAVRGLHGVFVYPDYRGEGHGARIVAAATNHLAAMGDDLGILFCEPELIPFYAAAGWEHVPGATTLAGSPASPHRLETDPDLPEERMMLFTSPRGEAARDALWNEPLYVGEATW